MKKLLYIIFTLGLISIIAIYFYTNQPHRDIKSEVPSFNISAQNLTQEFMSSQAIASNKFPNKTIIVNGKTDQILSKSLILEGNIFCTFDLSGLDAKINEVIYVKGRCIGYDDLLGEIQLDQCSIVNE